jgi:hypothetical protein
MSLGGFSNNLHTITHMSSLLSVLDQAASNQKRELEPGQSIMSSGALMLFVTLPGRGLATAMKVATNCWYSE